MKRLRVASMQYYLRPVEHYGQFEAQVVGLLETAADYRSNLVVFPEYFSAQLLTLGNVRRPMAEQVRDLAHYRPRILELMERSARRHGFYIVAGTVPTFGDAAGDRVYNDCLVFGPSGRYGSQGKLHMTRWEVEDWKVSPRSGLTVFETDFGRMAVAVCYDVEFPEIARAAARQGAHLLVAPSCTDDRYGYLRVRYCAHARAIENQMYVVVSGTVGTLPMVPAVALNYGQAAILTPSDFPFARDGVLAEGLPNQETMIIGDLDLEIISESRQFGTVLPLLDSARTATLVADLHVTNI